MSYPKWVSRGHGIGEVLCRNAKEEAEITAEREARESPEPEADGGDQGDEAEAIRVKLRAAGIKFHPAMGLEKLRALLPAIDA